MAAFPAGYKAVLAFDNTVSVGPLDHTTFSS